MEGLWDWADTAALLQVAGCNALCGLSALYGYGAREIQEQTMQHHGAL